MDLEIFIGRFHPLFVHLPIGFILMAVFLEGIGWWTKSKEKYDAATTACLGLGALTGGSAILTGWLLSNTGSYQVDTVWFHKWMAITTILITSVLFLTRFFSIKVSFLNDKVVLFLLFALLSFTGHQGGNLTHGSTYLVEYAPEFIQDMAGLKKSESISLEGKSTDSIIVYQHLIQPVFQKKCFSCHGTDKQSGNLNLTKAKNLFKKADSGQPIFVGNPFKSELYTRITLPHDDKKYMPTNEEPINFTDIQIIKRWIELGADTLAIFKPEDLSPDLVKAIYREYGLDYSIRPYIEKVKVAPMTLQQAEKLTELGFSSNTLSHDNNLLDVEFKGTFSTEQSSALNNVSDKITWLKFSEVDLSSAVLPLEKYQHITRMDFYKSELPEQLFDNIDQLKHLKSLNLYGTNTTDTALKKIETLKSLSRIYLGNTKTSKEAIEALAASRPDIKIII